MRGLRIITPWVGAAVILTCARTNACHVGVHYTKAEIEAADIRLYERDVHIRELDITRFDHRHHLLGEVLGNQQFFEQEWHEWKSHPGLFDHEHRGLSRVLEGDMLYHKEHPTEPSTLTIPPAVLRPGNAGVTVLPGGEHPGGGNPDSGTHTSSVPEPGSGVLGLTALMIVGLYAVFGRSHLNFV